jgi:hypothetical protein
VDGRNVLDSDLTQMKGMSTVKHVLEHTKEKYEESSKQEEVI